MNVNVMHLNYKHIFINIFFKKATDGFLKVTIIKGKVHVPIPQRECNYYVLQICTILPIKKSKKLPEFSSCNTDDRAQIKDRPRGQGRKGMLELDH